MQVIRYYGIGTLANTLFFGRKMTNICALSTDMQYDFGKAMNFILIKWYMFVQTPILFDAISYHPTLTLCRSSQILNRDC